MIKQSFYRLRIHEKAWKEGKWEKRHNFQFKIILECVV